MKILQVPNWPLSIALISLLINEISTGFIRQLGVTVYTVSIIIWAYLEITSGINWVRRFLGFVVILSTAYSLFNQLH